MKTYIVTHGAIVRAIQFYFETMPEAGKLLNVDGQKIVRVENMNYNNDIMI